jgi:hypothetical protein
MEINILKSALRKNVGDVTFYEAYERTGKILNITVSPANDYERPRLLNYLTSPNVLIWSAACASCAFPILYQPVELVAKNEVSPFPALSGNALSPLRDVRIRPGLCPCCSPGLCPCCSETRPRHSESSAVVCIWVGGSRGGIRLRACSAVKICCSALQSLVCACRRGLRAWHVMAAE